MDPKYTNSARYKCLEHLKKHSVDLYICYCGMEECDPGHSYGPTTRTEFLLHYILSGKGIYEVDGKSYHVKKNDAFIIYPNELTYYKADDLDPWTYIWIGFGGIKAESCLNYASLNRDNRISQFTCDKFLLNCVKNMLAARKLTYANDLKRVGYLFLFLSALIEENHNSSSNRKADYPFEVYVEHALKFIDHNSEKDIKINDIAKYIGINRSYLTKIFKKCLNISPQHYLVNYRLDKACSLLKTTSLPVNSVANMVGYSDPLTFSKVFKVFYNVSPSTYRTQHEELIHSKKKGE